MRKRLAHMLIALAGVVAVASRAHGLCVKVDQANLRTGPGGLFPVSWVVGRNMPLLPLDQRNNWTQVADLDGEKHWVANSSVTSSFQCLAVKAQWAKLRTGPGTSYPTADIPQVERYVPMKRFEMEDGWYKVEAPDGQKAWVHESAVWRPVKIMNVNF